MRTRHVVLVLVLMLVCDAAFAQDGTLLRAKYAAGQKYLAVMTTDQDIVQKLAGGENPVKQYFRFEMPMEVTALDAEGNALIKVTYRRIALKLDSTADSIDYDSADENKATVEHDALVGFKALVGKSITLTVSNRGEVKHVNGLKELAEGILADIPAGPARQAARGQLAAMLDEERFARQMAKLGVILPETPVTTGSTWDSDQPIDLGYLRLTMKTKYTVKGIAADVATVAVDSTVTPGGEGAADLPVQITVLDGKQTGEVKVSTANAALSISDVRQDLRLKVTVRGQTIEMTVKGNTNTRITRM